jgi:beta-xylosidase
LLHDDGSPKLAAKSFPEGMGICQWFHYEDPRLDLAVEWLQRLGVRYLRTGISWADWFRPNAEEWFDRQMQAVDPFTTTLTLCFTPEHMGLEPHYTSPPKRVEDFVEFAMWSVRKYATAKAPKKDDDILIGAK